MARVVVGKRKRGAQPDDLPVTKKPVQHKDAVNGTQSKSTANSQSAQHTSPHSDDLRSDIAIQVVTGSYERVLHGFSAAIPRALFQDEAEQDEQVKFTETFLFAAHTASIRCLAISPPAGNDKRYLATGSSDERINVYSVSTVPPKPDAARGAPTLNGSVIAENASNRSLGSLVHHDRAIACLQFPTKAKLFSAAEDNTIAISRTRDWTMLSSIKAPIPKPQGRPSGDTAAPGEVPAGINDFAIHPSQKLMLSVSRGERCMRLWNLMTGKKAGVLNFDRALLAQVGEGKYSSGEGRRVLWDGSGENFIVGFGRGAVVFDLESQPRAVIKPAPTTKLHQFRLLPRESELKGMLAISTEDGRLLFFQMRDALKSTDGDADMPTLRCVAQLGGVSVGSSSRVKDFELLPVESVDSSAQTFLAVTASSDGAIRVWSIRSSDLEEADAASSRQIGRLLATHETTNRITCLGAFVMDGKPNNDVSQKDAERDQTAEDSDSEEE